MDTPCALQVLEQPVPLWHRDQTGELPLRAKIALHDSVSQCAGHDEVILVHCTVVYDQHSFGGRKLSAEERVIADSLLQVLHVTAPWVQTKSGITISLSRGNPQAVLTYRLRDISKHHMKKSFVIRCELTADLRSVGKVAATVDLQPTYVKTKGEVSRTSRAGPAVLASEASSLHSVTSRGSASSEPMQATESGHKRSRNTMRLLGVLDAASDATAAEAPRAPRPEAVLADERTHNNLKHFEELLRGLYARVDMMEATVSQALTFVQSKLTYHEGLLQQLMMHERMRQAEAAPPSLSSLVSVPSFAPMQPAAPMILPRRDLPPRM